MNIEKKINIIKRILTKQGNLRQYIMWKLMMVLFALAHRYYPNQEGFR